MARFASPGASALVGGLLVALAFGARTGADLRALTFAELAIVAVATTLMVLALVRGRRGPLHGALALALLGVLAVLTALSVSWSMASGLSWIEANRTMTYLFVFAGGLALARLAPRGAPALLRGVLLGAAVVTAYALVARVFPASLAAAEDYARPGLPYGYWNAVGVTAALALPAALWLGARRTGRPWATALAYPLTGLFLITILLTLSRSALIAAALGVVLWLVIVPLRLRSLPVLLVPAAAGAPLVAWAISKDAFNVDDAPDVVRTSIGAELGLALLATLVVLTVLGFAIGFAAYRRPPSVSLRRRAGIIALAAAVLLPVLAAGGVTAKAGGPRAAVEEGLSRAVSERGGASSGAARLGQVGSARGQYWREALDVHREHKVVGAGAGAFEVARLRFRDSFSSARHAHGFVVQTLADLGFAGLAVSVLFALAWIVAAARSTATGPRLRRRALPRPHFDADRVALVALALVPVVFAVQGLLDWTWFVPATAVAALFAAGFVAGRGPAAAPPEADSLASPQAEDAPLADPAEASSRATEPRRRRFGLGGLLPRLTSEPGLRGLAGAGLVALALVAAWAIWQPQRSEARAERAEELSAEQRGAEGLREARGAARANPLALEPLLAEATALDAAGRRDAALATLRRAVREHRYEPESWYRLADYQLYRLDRPEDAARTLGAVFFLDPQSRRAGGLFLEAQVRVRTRREAAEARRVALETQRREAAEAERARREERRQRREQEKEEETDGAAPEIAPLRDLGALDGQ